MAGSISVLSQASKILKRNYSEKNIQKTFNDKVELLSLLDSKPQDVDEGDGFYYNFHTDGNADGGHIAESDDTPDAGLDKHGNMYHHMQQYVRPVRLTTKLMHATASKSAAYVKVLKNAVTNTLRNAKTDMGISLYTPHTGLLAKCTQADDTTHFYVQYGAHRRLRVGQTVAVARISDESVANGKASTKITAIDSKTGKITVDTALTGISWSHDDYGVSDHGVFHILEFGKEVSIHGIEDIISDSNPVGPSVINFGNVDRSAAGNDWAKAHVLDLEGADIDHDGADEAASMPLIDGNGEVEFWLTTPEIAREIKKLAMGTKQGTMATKAANEWYSKASLADLPVVIDKFCTPGTIYGIDRSALRVAEEKATGWEDMDGSMWHLMESKLAYQALLTRHWQLVGNPRNLVKIINVHTNRYAAA